MMARDIAKSLGDNVFYCDWTGYIKDEIKKKYEKGEEKCGEIIQTTRIGIDYAEEAKDYPYRFYYKDNSYVSRK